MNDVEEPKQYTPVAAISKEERCAVLTDGRICEFATMYDAEGDETDEVEAAVIAVAPHPEGTWLVLQLHEFDGMTIH